MHYRKLVVEGLDFEYHVGRTHVSVREVGGERRSTYFAHAIYDNTNGKRIQTPVTPHDMANWILVHWLGQPMRFRKPLPTAQVEPPTQEVVGYQTDPMTALYIVKEERWFIDPDEGVMDHSYHLRAIFDKPQEAADYCTEMNAKAVEDALRVAHEENPYLKGDKTPWITKWNDVLPPSVFHKSVMQVTRKVIKTVAIAS